jgi:hypothetical protein
VPVVSESTCVVVLGEGLGLGEETGDGTLFELVVGVGVEVGVGVGVGAIEVEEDELGGGETGGCGGWGKLGGVFGGVFVGVDDVLELVGVVSGGGDVGLEGLWTGVDSYPLAGGGSLEELL